MHEIWCFGYDGITCEVYPTARVDLGSGVVGQFLSDHLAENGRRILILGQIFINGSVKLVGTPNFHINSGLMYTDNLLDTQDNTCWGDGGTSNHNWGVHPGGLYSMWSVTWSGNAPARPAYMPRIPENARCCVPHMR